MIFLEFEVSKNLSQKTRDVNKIFINIARFRRRKIFVSNPQISLLKRLF